MFGGFGLWGSEAFSLLVELPKLPNRRENTLGILFGLGQSRPCASGCVAPGIGLLGRGLFETAELACAYEVQEGGAFVLFETITSR